MRIARFQLLKELGHGGMATVYLAKDVSLEREVALKRIHPHLRDSKEVRQRFAVEAKAIAKLRHRNIVDVFEVSADQESEPYIVCELIRGSSLREILEAHGPLPVDVAVAIGIHLLEALCHAHEAGVIHRDVKPENVLLEGVFQDKHMPSADSAHQSPAGVEGIAPRVLLTDFGLAKLLDGERYTVTGQVLGSPAYMAPELLDGRDADVRSDVFALGVLLYESISGVLPFAGKTPGQVLKRILDGKFQALDQVQATAGKRYASILDKALQSQPEKRYETCAAFAEALKREFAAANEESPAQLLAEYFHAPKAFAVAHAARMVGKLVALGESALKKGEPLEATEHFNRALAYAPDDMALLKRVVAMQSAQKRRRHFRSVLGALVVVGGLLAMTKVFPLVAGNPRAGSSVTKESDAEVSSAVGKEDSAAGEGIPPEPVAATPTPDAGMVVFDKPQAAGGGGDLLSGPRNPETAGAQRPFVEGASKSSGKGALGSPMPLRNVPVRTIVIAQVTPPFGVRVQVDSNPEQDLTVPQGIPMDESAHVLRFRCVNDACEPQERKVEAGVTEARLSITMKIRPAFLVVEGEPALTYQVLEEPGVLMRSGVRVPVPMNASRRRMTVQELPSGRSRQVLVQAGEVATVRFLGEAQEGMEKP